MKRTCALFVSIALVGPVLEGCSDYPSPFGTHGGSVDPPHGRISTPDDAPPAHGVAVTDVAVFQAVKASLARRNARVVASRDALVRVYVNPAADALGKTLTATLALTRDGRTLATLTDEKTIEGASTDADVASTFDFDVPAAALPAGVSLSVFVADAPRSIVARYPKDGAAAPVFAEDAGGPLAVTLVPMAYGADGSSRLPDTSPGQVALIRDTIFARFPAPAVVVDVREPMAFGGELRADGDGWNDALRALVALRAKDHPADDVYYVGLIAPAESRAAYCGRQCTDGLTLVADDERDPSLRASVVLGFTGGEVGMSAAHELGHAHGRRHAPCGDAEGIDASYPYADGSTGVWGYQSVTERLLDPAEFKDMMAYCAPSFVSDYTWNALFDRMQRIHASR